MPSGQTEKSIGGVDQVLPLTETLPIDEPSIFKQRPLVQSHTQKRQNRLFSKHAPVHPKIVYKNYCEENDKKVSPRIRET